MFVCHQEGIMVHLSIHNISWTSIAISGLSTAGNEEADVWIWTLHLYFQYTIFPYTLLCGINLYQKMRQQNKQVAEHTMTENHAKIDYYLLYHFGYAHRKYRPSSNGDWHFWKDLFCVSRRTCRYKRSLISNSSRNSSILFSESNP